MSTPTRTRSQPSPIRRHVVEGEGVLHHQLAQVEAMDGVSLMLRLGARTSVPARRAVGCLLEPVVGDTVACLCDAAGAHVWVVHVLERSQHPACHRLSAPGPFSLGVGATTLTLSEESLTLQTPMLQVAATQVHASGEQAEVLYTRLHLFVQLLKTVGNTCSTVFDQVQHYAQRHLRTTQGLDRVQAQQLDLQAEQLLQLHGQHTLVDGEKLIKARGAQIHFG